MGEGCKEILNEISTYFIRAVQRIYNLIAPTILEKVCSVINYAPLDEYFRAHCNSLEALLKLRK